jgi:hypothetical protein
VVPRGSATLAFTVDANLLLGGPKKGFGILPLTADATLKLTQFGSVSTNPSIAAFPDPLNSPPRLLIQAANIAGPSATVTRYGPDGIGVHVRLGEPATLNSGGWVGYDYEAPYNQPVYYTIVPANGAVKVASPPVTLTVTQPWLVHPGVPSLSQPVTVKVIQDETDASTAGVHQILERSTPIVVSDGVRKAPTFQMQLKSETADERDALRDLFADCAVLLMQVVYPFTTESDYRWVYITDVTRARKTESYGSTARVWTLPCIEVDRPVGNLQAQRTWADLMAECPTWQDVLNTYVTWRGVLTGQQGT